MHKNNLSQSPLQLLDKGEANWGCQAVWRQWQLPWKVDSDPESTLALQFLCRKFSCTEDSKHCVLHMVDTQKHTLTWIISLAGNNLGVYKSQVVFYKEKSVPLLRRYPWLLPGSSKCLLVFTGRPESVHLSIGSNLSRLVRKNIFKIKLWRPGYWTAIRNGAVRVGKRRGNG